LEFSFHFQAIQMEASFLLFAVQVGGVKHNVE